jgi:hypothetical protein
MEWEKSSEALDPLCKTTMGDLSQYRTEKLRGFNKTQLSTNTKL